MMTTDFYTNLLEVAEKTDKGYTVDIEKMFEGLKKKGMYIYQLPFSKIISRTPISEEELKPYIEEENRFIERESQAVSDYIDKQILKRIMPKFFKARHVRAILKHRNKKRNERTKI